MKVLFNHGPEVAAWVKDRIPHVTDFGPCEALGVVDDRGVLAAGVVYNGWLPWERNLEMSVAAARVNWCRPSVLCILFSYPFLQLGARRVSTTARAGGPDRHVRRFAQHLGFKYEGIRREFYPDGVNAVGYGMLKRECRWLADEERLAA